MIKRKITETIREYDDTGRLVKETVKETEEDDRTVYVPSYSPVRTYPTPGTPSEPYIRYDVTCSNLNGETNG